MRLVTLAAALIAVLPVAALDAQPPGSHSGRSPHGPTAGPGGRDHHRPELYGPRAHGHRHQVCRMVGHGHHRVRRCSYH